MPLDASPSGQWNQGLSTLTSSLAPPLWLSTSPIGEQLKYVFQILFEVSNNEAEYEALLHGLCLAVSLGIK
jgi:hypothetical protein